MTRSSPGTNFNSSRLVRFLAELSIVDVAESKQAFAERLGLWLDFSDAIALHAAHGSASAAVQRSDRTVVQALADEFAAARAAWAKSIAAGCSTQADQWPMAAAAADSDEAAAYELYRRYYSAQQGEMEVAIRPWRSKARQALAQAGGKLGQLAAIDGALDKILGARERQLLATVPALLEKRFTLLASAHRQRLAAAGQPDDPARWGAPGGWLADFGKELVMVLLAELDLRLQPTVGLIEALSNEAG
jgi:hypothetical protein